jgi:hypothetical protein
MAEIVTKKQFVEKLLDLQAMEMAARDMYQQDMRQFKDKKLVLAINQIKLDELRHIAMLQELIDFLK